MALKHSASYDLAGGWELFILRKPHQGGSASDLGYF
jgi:hypothetical protein